ncbi:hypothetical protein BGW36DRAFT_406880 [Talaromyces proteolyticus]|uniref:Uncharacterized protein n=1 Tax=Talaromyces proteolyticus TaxID=1131652 RepID=A0AAD4KRW9_9EURO|nr:uncharacterized protein BGW36DRAFT_406880 [Talaromyces proteolyticus]KAH8699035.1 hypothetical protein BGW36DRAFT_406880 [Talaromyces proteolyticus]
MSYLAHFAQQVLAGSSSTGHTAIKILRLALPDAVLISTNFEQYLGRRKARGATVTPDYNLLGLVGRVRETTADKPGIGAMVNAVKRVVTGNVYRMQTIRRTGSTYTNIRP